MVAFIVFIISLVLIVLLFTIKGLDIYYGRKIFLENLFVKSDNLVLKSWANLKFWWSHVNFKNTRRVISWVVIKTHRIFISIKRQFDHEQSSFFVKREPVASNNKGSTSFFLKDVSDYKKSLREERENNIN